MLLLDLITENNTYSKFKKSIKHRSSSEQLHKAIKEVKIKLKEIDILIEHTSKLKYELCENDDTVPYWKRTESNIFKLKEMTQKIYSKINSLIK